MSDQRDTVAPAIIKLLANDERWTILKTLSVGDYSQDELAAAVDLPSNRVAHHLEQFRDLNIITERTSSVDIESTYYALRLDHLQTLYFQAGASLHVALGVDAVPQLEVETLPSKLRVLFLCTHNSARSQMAEGLARHLGRGRVESFSAGTEETFVKPSAIEAMASRGIDISHQKSEVLTKYLDQEFDYVITVCDSAKESCPFFPGGKQQLHWSIEDPSSVEEPAARLEAFKQTASILNTRIQFLLMIAQRKDGITLASQKA